jgi:hypothetical protein
MGEGPPGVLHHPDEVDPEILHHRAIDLDHLRDGQVREIVPMPGDGRRHFIRSFRRSA